MRIEHDFSKGRDPLSELFAIDSWSSGVDVDGALQKVRGPFIDIGGPTKKDNINSHYDSLINLNILPKRIHNINIAMREGVSIIADGEMLPFPDNSLGAVFSAFLPVYIGGLRERVLSEAKRTLERGGFFITVDATDDELIEGFNLGFELAKYKKIPEEDECSRGCNIVFRKP